MSFLIESGLSIPASRRLSGGRPRALRYPFNKMSVGDSFLVKVVENRRSKKQSEIATYARSYVKRSAPNAKFVTRTMPEGVRCWRVQ